MTTRAVVPVAARSPWNTPQTLKIGRGLVIALDVLFFLAVLWGAHVHRGSMQTVGVKSAPSIIHAQHIRAELADMDADAADEMLSPPNTATAAGAAFDHAQLEASEALIDAAANAAYEAEKDPIEALTVSTGTYERLIQQAEDLHDAGSPDDVRYYRGAALVMDGTLLPAAADLDAANKTELDNTYKGDSGKSLLSRACVGLAGLVTCLALIWLQRFLSQHTQRTINPMLLLATLLTAGFCLYALTAMGIEENDLKVADEDAFVSIHALWQARAIAYAANADESRWLVDPAHADEYARGFQQKAHDLATLPPGMPLDTLLRREAAKERVPGFTGYLADELNNITFHDEQEAAALTLRTFEKYLEIDAEIRDLEHDGKHADAILKCIGTNPGDSDWAFAQFNDALGQTLEINQKAFDDAVGEGLGALTYMEGKAAIAAALIALLVCLGLVARIKEYE